MERNRYLLSEMSCDCKTLEGGPDVQLALHALPGPVPQGCECEVGAMCDEGAPNGMSADSRPCHASTLKLNPKP